MYPPASWDIVEFKQGKDKYWLSLAIMDLYNIGEKLMCQL